MLVDVLVGNAHAEKERNEERQKVELKAPGALKRRALEYLQRNLGLAPLGVDEVVLFSNGDEGLNASLRQAAKGELSYVVACIACDALGYAIEVPVELGTEQVVHVGLEVNSQQRGSLATKALVKQACFGFHVFMNLPRRARAILVLRAEGGEQLGLHPGDPPCGRKLQPQFQF